MINKYDKKFVFQFIFTLKSLTGDKLCTKKRFKKKKNFYDLKPDKAHQQIYSINNEYMKITLDKTLF